MNYINVNPGIKIGMRQTFTITLGGGAGKIFFLTYDADCDKIIWNQFVDDVVLKAEIEEILRNYLTNQ